MESVDDDGRGRNDPLAMVNEHVDRVGTTDTMERRRADEGWTSNETNGA